MQWDEPCHPTHNNEEDRGHGLLWAAAAGLPTVVERLLALGADPCSAKDSLGRTALMLAAGRGQLDVVRELISPQPPRCWDTPRLCRWLRQVHRVNDSMVKRVTAAEIAGETLHTVDQQVWMRLGARPRQATELADACAMLLSDEGRVAGREILLRAVDNNGASALHFAAACPSPEIVAVLLEAVQGEGGVNVPDANYLREVSAWCDEHDLLLILDEVQTGVGRTGTLWAYEQTGIEPDIMTLAKGLGGGVPIGCLLAKEAASVFEPGDHGTTFGGNPLATAAGTYVMQQLIDGGVMDNVTARSDQLTQRLESLADRSDAVEGQRGKGLLRALVLSEEIAGAVALEAMERGLFVNAVRPNAIRFMPALTVTEDEIDRAVAIVEDALASVTS